MHMSGDERKGSPLNLRESEGNHPNYSPGKMPARAKFSIAPQSNNNPTQQSQNEMILEQNMAEESEPATISDESNSIENQASLCEVESQRSSQLI